MEDNYEITLKNVCCTCLSTERKLFQLCRIDNAVNDLFFLLSRNSEAYEAIFVKDVMQLFICWECSALMGRLSKFREQACIAQDTLTDIADGKINYSKIKCLSKLTYTNDSWCSQAEDVKLEAPDNFVDCGLDIMDIKIESDTDDIPLAQLNYLKNLHDERETDELPVNISNKKDGVKKGKRKIKNKVIGVISIANDVTNDVYSTNEMSDEASIGTDDIISTSHKKKVKRIDLASSVDVSIVKHEVNDNYNSNKMSDEDMLDSMDIIKSKGSNNFKSKDVTGYNVNIPILNSDNYSNKNTVKNNHSCKFLYQNNIIKDETKICWEIIKMNEIARLKSIDERKKENVYISALNKCESCIEIFEYCDDLEKHISDLHTLKPNHLICKICHVYVKCKKLDHHIREHYIKYQCRICKQSSYDTKSFAEHLKTKHYMQDSYIDSQLRRLCMDRLEIISRMYRETKPCDVNTEPEVGAKPLKIMIDDPKGRGFACVECHKYFMNKNILKKHVLKCHREGYQCSTCGKKFSLITSLRRHETIHCEPLPREPCPVCGKMVRSDLVKTHAQIHTSRSQFSCLVCDKKFVSRRTYKNHLKSSRSHVDKLVLKYKCATCGKNYRAPSELRDHINYAHMGKTHHKCPICDKALATARCVTRHVRRAHYGVKENARDKICQSCGKQFTCTKSLREHELIHTGEKPLSCDICSRTFRQKACLYTHKRRVHKVAFKKRLIQHTDDIVVNLKINKSSD